MEETKEISRERISSGFLKLYKVTYERGEHKFDREIVHRGDAVAGLLFNTKTKKFIFTKQFRPGAGCEMIEIVAGTMDVIGESPEDCLCREIEEETGYIMSTCGLISKSYASPGGSTEKMYIFIAETDGEKVSEGGGVGDEGIEVIEYTQEEMSKNIDELSKDLKTLLAINYYFAEDILI